MLSAPALPIGRRQERSRKLELAARDADALDRKIGARSARIRSTAAISDSPAGRQIAWYLDRVSSGAEGSSEGELGARCALKMIVRAPFPYPHEVNSGG